MFSVDWKADHTTFELVQHFPCLRDHQDYKPGTTKARLVEALNHSLRTMQMPRSRKDRSRISRAYFAELLGVTPSAASQLRGILGDYEAVLAIVEPVSSLPQTPKFGAKQGEVGPLDNVAREVVSRYPDVSKHQHYPLDSTAGKIVQILNEQIFTGGLEKSRGGKISRKALTDKLGFVSTAANAYLEILEDYEEATGGRVSAIEAKIPAIRAWLETQMLQGSLLLRDGKIRRIQLYDQFNIPSSVYLARYPQLAALIDEFDQKIATEGYQPRDIATKLSKLKEILAANPPIDKDGRSICKN